MSLSILHSMSIIVVPNRANLLSQPKHSRLCSGPTTAQALSLSSSSSWLLRPVRHSHLTPHSFMQHVNGSEEGLFCWVSIPWLLSSSKSPHRIHNFSWSRIKSPLFLRKLRSVELLGRLEDRWTREEVVLTLKHQVWARIRHHFH